MGKTVRFVMGVVCLALTIGVGCGGGGGGDAPVVLPPVVSLLGTVTATPPDSSLVLDLKSNGEVDFDVTVPASAAGDVTAVQLHPRNSVLAHAADVIVDLLASSGAAVDPATGMAEGTATVTSAVAAAIVANPGDFLVQILSPSLPGGRVEASLGAPVDVEWHASLTEGANGALGAACLHARTDGSLTYVLAMLQPLAADVVGAQIRIGPAGASAGTVLLDLDAASATVDALAGTVAGSVALPRDVLTRLTADPLGFHVAVSTATESARGQLEAGRRELKARLERTAAAPGVLPDASGSIVVEIACDGALEYAATAQASYVASINGMHIHRGSTDAIVVDLLAGGTFDASTLTNARALTIESALAAEILAAPERFYVNVHTTQAPTGLVSGTLSAFEAQQLHTVLLGTNEVPAADANARGAATIDIASNGRITYAISLVSPPIEDLTDAHIHIGGPTVSGVVMVNLELGKGSLDLETGTVVGTVTAPPSAISRICQDPAGFYVNVHTDAHPLGAARGQLGSGVVEMWAPLRGDQETQVVDAAARGGVALFLNSFTSGHAHLAVPAAQGIGDVTAAHVHRGGAGVDGTVEIPLTEGADYAIGTTTGSAEGGFVLEQSQFTRLLANPAGHYVNFHTDAAPLGLARGQLTRDPMNFRATMLAANETVTPADPNGAGTITVVFDDIEQCHVVIDTEGTSASEVTAAHIHEGAAGVDGNALIDLGGGSGFQVSSDRYLIAHPTFGGRTFARLLAAPEEYYANVHTASSPLGAFRGQTTLVLDGAPAGLAYDRTDVSFETGGNPIEALVPFSTGGPIHRYAIDDALPGGLVLDPLIGVISGRPTQTKAAQTYTVTAFNAQGQTTATFILATTPGQPTNLVYTSPVSYVQNEQITPNVPTNDGGVITTYSVDPALPAGLTLDASTGVISGTPTGTSAAADYTVTGSNASGFTTAKVNITVTAALQAPSISYNTPVVFDTGTAITNQVPTNTGGTVASWSISPTLPAGLSFSTSTGVISGTPTATASAMDYTVTATNAAGTGTFKISITVNLGKPANLTYSPSTSVGYVQGNTFTQMDPSVEGGAVASYSVSPALPNGIVLNSTTGVISHTTLTTASDFTLYTVTATNAAGSTTAVIYIAVLDQ